VNNRLFFVVFALFAHSLFSAPLDKQTFMVPMRDGVHLATDVYKPNTNLAYPVILYRTPYNKNTDGFGNDTINLLNAFGYVYIAQDCRGRFNSEGTDSIFVTDGWGPLQDGYDTIDWIVQQSWCNGKVAMVGGSATGITTLRAAGALHPNMICAAALVTPSDFYHQVVYPGGEFRKSLTENWVYGQGSNYMVPYFLQFPYYNELWEQMDLHTRTPLISIPILHLGGWYDCFSDGTIAAFTDLQKQPNGGFQKLVMGPWVHGDPSSRKVGELKYPDAGFDWENVLLRWLNCWLRDIPDTILTEPPVTFYLMGDPSALNEAGCEWVYADTWPPENRIVQSFFLNPSGTLSETKPEFATKSFLYDPNNPVPTLGGNNLTIPYGPYDQRAINQRDDILGFSSLPLTQPLRVEGTVFAHLTISSNCPDTDFTLKLLDVYPDGREMLVTDGIQRVRFRDGYTKENEKLLSSGETVTLEIQLPPTAIVFNSGHQIKVDISSSNYPRFEVNPNIAFGPNDRAVKQVAENTVHFGGLMASFINLPVVPQKTFVEEKTDVLDGFELYANFPNPFNSGTTIQYDLPKTFKVRIEVVNMLGQRVRLLENSIKQPGSHNVVWDGRFDSGESAPSGLYVYRIITGGYSTSSSMVLVN
jgi:uncharacterized protein